MNQHKDLLYRQKYATYQLNNRTLWTQNTNISARSLTISYICFQVPIVKKKKKKKKNTINYYGNLVTPAPPAPDKGSVREIATGEITVSITPDDHLEGPYLLKTRDLPGAPPPGPQAGALRRAPGPHPYEKNRMFQTHARSISFFSGFLFSSQYNEQDHITSVTNTVMDILYRQTVIYQQCILLRYEKNRIFSTQIFKKSARSLRSLAIWFTFSPVSNASSFKKAY